MLSGERPFKGDYVQTVMYSIRNENPKSIKKVNVSVPVELEQIVIRCLQKKPESCDSSVQSMTKELKACQDSQRVLGVGTFHIRTFL